MKKTQNLLIVTVVILVAGILVTGALIWASRQAPQIREQQPAQENKEAGQRYDAASLTLRPDKGLNMEYVDLQSLGVEFGNIDPDSVGERAIFERYRFYDTGGEENAIDIYNDEDALDIRLADVRAFIINSDGTEEEIAADNRYYLRRIYPFADSGTYSFRVETAEGTIYSNELTFPKPQQVNLVFSEGVLEDSEGVSVQELRMGDLDLNSAESVFHILPDNTIKDLVPDANGSVIVGADILARDYHIFLAKQGGAWYYATYFAPEES